MRSAQVYLYDIFTGILTEDENGYTFCYDNNYLENNKALAISNLFPLQSEAYRSNILFPFFDGLIPEGWLLDIAQNNWKINTNDRMGLLLACCKDCIGAVSIMAVEHEK